MSIRPATHAGTWYPNSSIKLGSQLEGYFKHAHEVGSYGKAIKGARILIGPHAGFTYSGARLAETFTAWDTSKVKRVFILGPSHHVYFKSSALVSRYEYYETPFGKLPVDVEVTKKMTDIEGTKGNRVFKYMSEDVDDDEHSFEMHAPFIYHKCKNLPQGMPLIIPIMISGMGDRLSKDIVDALLPYLDDEQNTFIISSDFCHWGSRFGYTKYLPQKPTKGIQEDDLINLRHSTKTNSAELPIYQSIELLDREAMDIASKGSYNLWQQYISITGNTICGQKPIGIILRLLEEYEKSGKSIVTGSNVFNWINYSQSSEVHKYSDSSVSYASGYVQLT